MPRHSFVHQRSSRGVGLKGWLVGFGLILALFTGILTFLVGVAGWLFLGLLRSLASPFRSKKSLGKSGPQWTVRVGRSGQESRSASGSEGTVSGDRILDSKDPGTAESTSLTDVEDAQFEEIR